jgi:hypothetical protein
VGCPDGRVVGFNTGCAVGWLLGWLVGDDVG